MKRFTVEQEDGILIKGFDRLEDAITYAHQAARDHAVVLLDNITNRVLATYWYLLGTLCACYA
jgi:hypothetical protein